MSVLKHFFYFFLGVAWIAAIMAACEPQPCETDTECEARHGTE